MLRKIEKKERGVFEKVPGSGNWRHEAAEQYEAQSA